MSQQILFDLAAVGFYEDSVSEGLSPLAVTAATYGCDCFPTAGPGFPSWTEHELSALWALIKFFVGKIEEDLGYVSYVADLSMIGEIFPGLSRDSLRMALESVGRTSERDVNLLNDYIVLLVTHALAVFYNVEELACPDILEDYEDCAINSRRSFYMGFLGYVEGEQNEKAPFFSVQSRGLLSDLIMDTMMAAEDNVLNADVMDSDWSLFGASLYGNWEEISLLCALLENIVWAPRYYEDLELHQLERQLFMTSESTLMMPSNMRTDLNDMFWWINCLMCEDVLTYEADEADLSALENDTSIESAIAMALYFSESYDMEGRSYWMPTAYCMPTADCMLMPDCMAAPEPSLIEA